MGGPGFAGRIRIRTSVGGSTHLAFGADHRLLSYLRGPMSKVLSLVAAALMTFQAAAQTADPSAKRSSGNQIPASAGDDVRGYNDTPQLPNQKWKVHDMNRPRARKVTPGAYVEEAPPSDAIVLFNGKD